MSEFRLLHVADVHLGGSGPAFGDRVGEHQQRLEDAFARAIEHALIRQVTAVVIAGDLFYSPRPSERTLQRAVREISRLGQASPPIPCFILPGNHDCIEPGGLWVRSEWSAPHLHIWSQAGPASFRLADGSAAFHANAQTCRASAHRPFEGLAPDPTARWNVAVVHGAVVIPGLTDGDGSLIRPEEVAACGMDYVAIGHWHDPGDYSQGPVPAHYSGATELVNLTHRQPGGVYLVELSQSGVRLERLPTGSLRTTTLDVDADTHPDEAALAAAVRELADADLILDVTITGMAPEGFACDIAKLQQELEPQFFRLRISDESADLGTPLPEAAASEHLVAVRALELFRAELEQAQAAGDADRERMIRRAMRLSAALFDGREVLG